MTTEYVMVPREAWDFLCGAGPLDGVWFGNPHPKHLGAFWWRSYICAMLQAAPPAPAMHASAPTGMKCADCYMDKEACPTCYSAWWKARHPHSQQMPEGAPPAPVAHSKSEYKRRVAMGDANVLPPAVQPAPVADLVVTDALKSIDAALYRVLHELAGAASMCWEPRPSGEFDSSKAIQHVESAINEIRGPLRAILAAQSGAGTEKPKLADLHGVLRPDQVRRFEDDWAPNPNDDQGAPQ